MFVVEPAFIRTGQTGLGYHTNEPQSPFSFNRLMSKTAPTPAHCGKSMHQPGIPSFDSPAPFVTKPLAVAAQRSMANELADASHVTTPGAVRRCRSVYGVTHTIGTWSSRGGDGLGSNKTVARGLQACRDSDHFRARPLESLIGCAKETGDTTAGRGSASILPASIPAQCLIPPNQDRVAH